MQGQERERGSVFRRPENQLTANISNGGSQRYMSIRT